MPTQAHSLKDLRRWWKEYVAAGYNVCELARRNKGSPVTWGSRIRSAMTRLGVAPPQAQRPMRKLRHDSMTEPQLRAIWNEYAAIGYSIAEYARSINASKPTVENWIRNARRLLHVQEPPEHLKPHQEPLDERQKRRYEDRILTLGTELRRAHRELNEAEDIRQAVFHLTGQALTPPAWTLAAPRSGDTPGIPILFTSDFQWGEVIKAPALGGVNEFNKDVASRRYKLLIEKTIELSFVHMARPKYDGLFYLRGGDMISGEIHADLRESNDLQAAPAVKDLVEHECAGIESLLKRFGKVHVVSVPGNHGRMTVKPQSKGAIERNLDTLSAWWLESQWKNEKRVTFYTPESGDAMLNVYGFRFLLTHGDRIGSRGGEGFIGAVATITRGMKKVADYYAALGQPLDLQFIGHFHCSLELEYGFANGSLPGYSEYARDLRMRPQPPKQWLVFAHPRHMVAARWPILLEPRPRLDARAEA